MPKLLNDVMFCYLGDARFNMASSYLVGGGGRRHPDLRPTLAMATSGNRRGVALHRERDRREDHDDEVLSEAVDGSTSCSRRLWVSMGEPDEVWVEQHKAALAVPGQCGSYGGDRQRRT